MKLELKDFYGQNITIHDQTASGNLCFEVKTTSDLNKVRITKKEDCDLTTDISLPLEKIILLKVFLESVIKNLTDE